MPTKGARPDLVEVDAAIDALRARGRPTPEALEGAARFGITTSAPILGVRMNDVKAIAKRIGRNHALAQQLWSSGIYDARMLACLVDEPDKVTPAQMNRWAKDFDNWATATPLVFIFSIARRTRTQKSASGRTNVTSSSSVPRSRSWRASRCTTRKRRIMHSRKG